MVEHRSTESEGLKFDSLQGLRIFSLSHACDKKKNIFLYFFTELKTYYLSFSIYNKILITNLKRALNFWMELELAWKI